MAIVIQIYPPFKFCVPLILSIFMNDNEFSEEERQKKNFLNKNIALIIIILLRVPVWLQETSLARNRA